jgi:hypothetical protein
MATVTVTNSHQVVGVLHTSQVSASAAPQKVGYSMVIWPMAAVIAATIVMWFANRFWINPAPVSMQIVSSYVPYVGIIAVTAALERFLEPLSHVLMPDQETKKTAAKKKSDAQAAAADPGKSAAEVRPDVQGAADAQAAADRRRTQRAILFWAIASVCGVGISGGFGFFLLQSVSTGHVNTFLDLAVTGLTIGAGTKPMHDVITGISKTSAAKA